MFVTTQGIFMYKDRLYKQMDGVTMRSLPVTDFSQIYFEHINEQLF